jgi:hypothetical protein
MNCREMGKAINQNILFVFLLLLGTNANASDKDFAFLVLKASVTDEIKQPTYICLYRKYRCKHIPATASFVKIKPGHYRLAHIDFSDLENSGRGTEFLKESIFKLKKGRVYFVGNLKLSNRSGGRFKIALEQEMSLLREACEALPEQVKLFPFANPNNGKATSVSCISFQ